MTMEETYTTPLLPSESEQDDVDDIDEEEKKEIQEFLDAFSIDSKTDEIAQLLEEHPETLKVLFEELVPTTVTYEHFWQAYFYRCDANRIAAQWEAEDERARAARQAAMRKSSRLRVDVDGQMFPVLKLEKTGFAVALEDAPNLRGLVDLYDGAKHLFQCLIVFSEEDGTEMRYEFKRATPVAKGAALDFERRAEAPVALISDAR